MGTIQWYGLSEMSQPDYDLLRVWISFIKTVYSCNRVGTELLERWSGLIYGVLWANFLLPILPTLLSSSRFLYWPHHPSRQLKPSSATSVTGSSVNFSECRSYPPTAVNTEWLPFAPTVKIKLLNVLTDMALYAVVPAHHPSLTLSGFLLSYSHPCPSLGWAFAQICPSPSLSNAFTLQSSAQMLQPLGSLHWPHHPD